MNSATWRWLPLLPAFAAAWPAPLRAQSGPDIVIEHADRTIPADGGLLVLVPTAGRIGAGAMAVPTRIEVKPVAGATHELGWIEDLQALSLRTTSVIGAAVVWTAAEPLVPGAHYDVQVALELGAVARASFTAGAAFVPERPELTIEARLEVIDMGDDEVHCCERFVDGSGHAGCFVARYAQRPALATRLQSDAPAEQLGQFVYRFRAFSQANGDTLWASGFRTHDSPVPFVPFLSPADEYCLEVQALHIVAQTTFTWNRCVPAATLMQAPPDPAPEIESALAIERCSVPQYGDLLQWCELNAATCAHDIPDCAVYESLCDATLTDALAMLLAMDEARAQRAVAGSIEDSGLHAARSGTDAGDAERRASDQGCTAHPAGLARDRTPWLSVLALCALLCSARVRRRAGRPGRVGRGRARG